MMNQRLQLTLLVVGVYVLSSACGPSQQALDDQATQVAAEIQSTQAAEERDRSRSATEEARSAVATADHATEMVVEQQATDQAATATQKSAGQSTATVEMAASATAQAQRMHGMVQELLNEGHLGTAEGTYHSLPDFDKTFAQLGWYRSYPTGYSPTNFVLRADAFWESASETADWPASGCGIVFRNNEDGDHFVAFMAMDGWNYIARNVNDRFSVFGGGFARSVETPADQAEIMLVANGTEILFFVDGQRVQTRHASDLPEGDIRLTLISGTNKGFGTRCRMENIDLWEIGAEEES